MKVTITAYSALLREDNGRSIPIGGTRINSQKVTAAGDVTLPAGCRFVRICSDTAIHFKPNGTGATDGDEMIPAGFPDHIATTGTTASFIAA